MNKYIMNVCPKETFEGTLNNGYKCYFDENKSYKCGIGDSIYYVTDDRGCDVPFSEKDLYETFLIDDTISKTPTLDKMLEIQEQSQLCGEFLEWLQRKYAIFEIKVARDNPFYEGVGDYINTEKLLAEFFGIDLEEAERERELLLQELE